MSVPTTRGSEELLLEALSRYDVQYGDLRWVEVEERGGTLQADDLALVQRRTTGLAVRVIVDGAWGFASTPLQTPEAQLACASSAVANARIASGQQPGRVRLKGMAPWQRISPMPSGEWPADLDVEATRALLRHSIPEGGSSEPRGALVAERRTWTRLATTEGSLLEREQLAHRCLGWLGPPMTRRTTCGDWAGGWSTGGLARCRAPKGPSRPSSCSPAAAAGPLAASVASLDGPIVLDSAAAGRLLLETLGRALEGPRVVGELLDSAGASVVLPEDVGQWQLAALTVSLVSRPDLAGAPSAAAWDDEGAPAEDRTLLRRGGIVGLLGSRELATLIPAAPPSGTCNAPSWDLPPAATPVGLELLSGKGGSLESLMASSGRGWLLCGCRACVTDDLLQTVRFIPEELWELVDGQPTRRVEPPALRGDVPELWSACEAVAGPQESRLLGLALGIEPVAWPRPLVGVRIPPLRLGPGALVVS